MLNTYQEAAQKIGISIHQVRRWVAARRISILNLGHSTKRITDAEITRVQERAVRKALR